MENIKWEYERVTFCDHCRERDCIKKTEEILDFANMVFSMEYSGTNFAALLPKAYSPKRSGIPVHHMIREEGKIKALIDLYPITLQLKGESGGSIKAAYVGTVSVHPGARGKGYMIELMKKAEEDARSRGCALMILDGSRHRYQHYGFELAGIRYRFSVETGNITHCCAGIYDKAYMASPVYSFEELEEQSVCLDSLYRLYQKRLVTARSREDFLLCLQSYSAAAYAILKGGKPVGYVSLSADGKNVSEIEMDDITELPRVLYDLMAGFETDRLGISVGMDETDKIVQLEKACEWCNVSMSHQIKILDYETVLAFLLNWKQKYDTLVRSDYVLGVRNTYTGSTENYRLSVREDTVSVSRTERAADAVFEELELVRVLTTSFFYVEQQKGERSKIKNAPAGWFPLPFYLPEADTF